MNLSLSDILIDTYRDRWQWANNNAHLLLCIAESGSESAAMAFDRNAWAIQQYCLEVN